MQPILFLVSLACVGADDPAAPEVLVAPVIEKTMPDFDTVTGKLVASRTVVIGPAISGRIQKIHFLAGSIVKKGDVLFTLDSRLQEAEVERLQAQLRVAEAILVGTEKELARTEELFKRGGATKLQLEKARAARDEAQAQLTAANAALSKAKLELESTRIVAPIDGRIGTSRVNEGELVMAGNEKSATLTTIVVPSPLEVVYEINELNALWYLAEAKKLGKPLEMAKLTAPVYIFGDRQSPRQATLHYLDRQLDPKTEKLTARALLANDDDSLLLGIFVNVRVFRGEPIKWLLIDSDAVRDPGSGPYVHVVTENAEIERRTIKHLTKSFDGQIPILQGLKAGERVVIKDTDKFKAGMKVRPRLAKPSKE